MPRLLLLLWTTTPHRCVRLLRLFSSKKQLRKHKGRSLCIRVYVVAEWNLSLCRTKITRLPQVTSTRRPHLDDVSLQRQHICFCFLCNSSFSYVYMKCLLHWALRQRLQNLQPIVFHHLGACQEHYDLLKRSDRPRLSSISSTLFLCPVINIQKQRKTERDRERYKDYR